MTAKRIIPCLDFRDGRVVKGVHFVNLRDAGDPVENARLYEAEGADKLVFLDISATAEGRATIVEAARKVAEQVSIPFALGGGVRAVKDVRRLLDAGAQKVGINTAAVRTPALISKAAAKFGSQAIEDEILKKVGEEAMEVILAAKGQGNERVVCKVADLFYHLLVLLAAHRLTLADVEAELVRRRR